jgi:hypothetical protein
LRIPLLKTGYGYQQHSLQTNRRKDIGKNEIMPDKFFKIQNGPQKQSLAIRKLPKNTVVG